MDAIQLIKKDHAAVERLFKQFERAERGGKAAEQRRVVRELTRELSIHAVVEEQLVYPALRRAGEEDEVLEALEEHHLVKLTLAELEGMTARDERYRAKVAVLTENVRHHVKEEERELLPRLEKSMSAPDLKRLGAAIETLKKVAPTRPHPAAPDTPPGNFVAGAMSSIVDRSKDALRDLADRGEARARGASRRGRGAVKKVAGNARKTARGAAGRVRAAARDLAGDQATWH